MHPRFADRRRRALAATPSSEYAIRTVDAPAIVIRPAHPEDAQALSRLAAIDSQAAPRGAVLVAEVEGDLRAALPIDGGPPVADPFRPTAALVALLAQRARDLRADTRRAAPRASRTSPLQTAGTAA